MLYWQVLNPSVDPTVFHGFGQVEFAYGGLILDLSPFLLLPATSKNNAQFRSGQNQPDSVHLNLLI